MTKLSRRDALKVGALGMLGGLAACSPTGRATESVLPTYAAFPNGLWHWFEFAWEENLHP